MSSIQLGHMSGSPPELRVLLLNNKPYLLYLKWVTRSDYRIIPVWNPERGLLRVDLATRFLDLTEPRSKVFAATITQIATIVVPTLLAGAPASGVDPQNLREQTLLPEVLGINAEWGVMDFLVQDESTMIVNEIQEQVEFAVY